jgi:hypothetical protein
MTFRNTLFAGLVGIIASCGGGTDSGCKTNSDCRPGRGCDVETGGCVECTPDSYKECDNGNVYWKDACGGLGELAEECASGCEGAVCLPEPCVDTKVCKDNNVYNGDSCGGIKDLVEDCGTKPCEDGVCVDENCRPLDYVNKCEGLKLKYCDLETSKVTVLDCPAEGYAHCGIGSQTFGSKPPKFICYGDAVYGDPCPNGKALNEFSSVVSECNSEIVDTCLYTGTAEPYCTVACESDRDCIPLDATCQMLWSIKYCVIRGTEPL